MTWWKKMHFPWNFSLNFWLLLRSLATLNPVYSRKAQLLNTGLSAQEWARPLVLQAEQGLLVARSRCPFLRKWGCQRKRLKRMGVLRPEAFYFQPRVKPTMRKIHHSASDKAPCRWAMIFAVERSGRLGHVPVEGRQGDPLNHVSIWCPVLLPGSDFEGEQTVLDTNPTWVLCSGFSLHCVRPVKACCASWTFPAHNSGPPSCLQWSVLQPCQWPHQFWHSLVWPTGLASLFGNTAKTSKA